MNILEVNPPRFVSSMGRQMPPRCNREVTGGHLRGATQFRDQRPTSKTVPLPAGYHLGSAGLRSCTSTLTPTGTRIVGISAPELS